MHIEAYKMRWGSGDNYCYVLSDDGTSDSWVIDATEPEKVLPSLKKDFVKAIVNTHHHWDHAGGNSKMTRALPGVQIIAGKESALVNYTPSHGEVLHLGNNLEITALHTPCHTQDSICYYVQDKATNEKAVFTGDTLFTSGCGRFFEGSPEQMDKALNHVLAKLPDETKVYPGHEYTASNVKFSKSILGSNPHLAQLENFVKENEVTTGAFTIKDEKLFNPFMMLADAAVLNATGKENRVDVMGQLRHMKNGF